MLCAQSVESGWLVAFGASLILLFIVATLYLRGLVFGRLRHVQAQCCGFVFKFCSAAVIRCIALKLLMISALAKLCVVFTFQFRVVCFARLMRVVASALVTWCCWLRKV